MKKKSSNRQSKSSKDVTLEKIAKDRLGIKILETRGWDTWDFYDLHVGNVKRALEDAYNAGRKSVR